MMFASGVCSQCQTKEDGESTELFRTGEGLWIGAVMPELTAGGPRQLRFEGAALRLTLVSVREVLCCVEDAPLRVLVSLSPLTH